MSRDYKIAEAELNLIYFHCQWRGCRVTEGLYRLSTNIAGLEFLRLLDKHKIPWTLRGKFVFVDIDFIVEREDRYHKISDSLTLNEALDQIV